MLVGRCSSRQGSAVCHGRCHRRCQLQMSRFALDAPVRGPSHISIASTMLHRATVASVGKWCVTSRQQSRRRHQHKPTATTPKTSLLHRGSERRPRRWPRWCCRTPMPRFSQQRLRTWTKSTRRSLRRWATHRSCAERAWRVLRRDVGYVSRTGVPPAPTKSV